MASSNNILPHELDHNGEAVLGCIVPGRHALAALQVSVAAGIQQQSGDRQTPYPRCSHQGGAARAVG